MSENIKWPVKIREMHSNHFDSTMWNDFMFRDDDIIISTYAKTGTTWVQQIVSQLLFDGKEGLPVADMSPWIDLRVPPKEEKIPEVEAQEHRRFIKTHLPVDALVFSSKAKYIYIARDGRDVLWSLYNLHSTANEVWYGALNDSPGLVGPPMGKPVDDIVQYYHDWLDGDGFPFWSFWENVRSWWEIRDLPNVYMLHFNNLKTDMPSEIRTMAAFLNISINEDVWEDILLHCSFDYMKKNATASTPLGGAFWDGGADNFVYKGINGRWKDRLTEEGSRKYENLALEKLGEECFDWLTTGRGL